MGGQRFDPRKGLTPFIVVVGFYLLAWLAMRASTPGGVTFSEVKIPGPEGKPILATLWRPPGSAPAKGAIMIGHGVTSNRSVMSMLALAAAWDGYSALAIDFWGHGRSREKFSWLKNAQQIQSCWTWLKERNPKGPVIYAGHSMGAFCGAEALVDEKRIDAFISMGALPDRVPACPALIAMGQFEELFSPAQAKAQSAKRQSERLDVVVSPFSDHATETWDPRLLSQVLNWLDGQLGQRARPFPIGSWILMNVAVLLGATSAVCIPFLAMTRLGTPPAESYESHGWARRLGFQYMAVARVFGLSAGPASPRSGSWPRKAFQGVFFGLAFVILLSFLLDRRAFVCSPLHPERLLLWLGFAVFLVPLGLLNSVLVESASPRNGLARFVVSSLGKILDLLVFVVVLRLLPGAAFASMMLGILVFVLVIRSLVYALATASLRDHRAGALAAATFLSWLIAFWFPLVF